MPFLVLDLEMSGPDPEWNDIIQIGAVLYDDHWKERGTYLENVYPENEDAFSSRSEAVHGLTLADLDDAPMLYELIPEMEDWIRGQLKRPLKKGPLHDVVVCGQSVIHDINFLKAGYRREKMRWPYSRKLIDLHTTSYLMFRILGRNGAHVPGKLSLDAVAGYFGLSREDDQHNALEDARLTAQCFLRFFALMDRMKLEQP